MVGSTTHSPDVSPVHLPHHGPHLVRHPLRRHPNPARPRLRPTPRHPAKPPCTTARSPPASAHIRGGGTTTRAVTITPATLDQLTLLAQAMPPRRQASILLATWCGLRFGDVTNYAAKTSTSMSTATWGRARPPSRHPRRRTLRDHQPEETRWTSRRCATATLTIRPVHRVPSDPEAGRPFEAAAEACLRADPNTADVPLPGFLAFLRSLPGSTRLLAAIDVHGEVQATAGCRHSAPTPPRTSSAPAATGGAEAWRLR